MVKNVVTNCLVLFAQSFQGYIQTVGRNSVSSQGLNGEVSFQAFLMVLSRLSSQIQKCSFHHTDLWHINWSFPEWLRQKRMKESLWDRWHYFFFCSVLKLTSQYVILVAYILSLIKFSQYSTGEYFTECEYQEARGHGGRLIDFLLYPAMGIVVSFFKLVK